MSSWDVAEPLSAESVAPFGTYPPNHLQSIVREVGQRLPSNKVGKRVSAWLRSLLRATSPHPIDVTVLGQRMRLRLLDNACERRLMVTPHYFDASELAILRSRMRPDFHFVDIGANVGTYSVFVGTSAGPEARIIAIEPQTALQVRLNENLALNGLSNVHVAPCAVSDHEGIIEFVIDPKNVGFTSLHTTRKGRGERIIQRMPVRRLLDIVREAGFQRIDAIKIDIEGAEDLALLPFFEHAPQSLWPSTIVIEDNSHEWKRDCIGFLRERGYEVIWARGARENVVLSRD